MTTTSAQHTPGPWEVYRGTVSGTDWPYYTVCANWAKVAEVSPQMSECQHGRAAREA